MILKILLCILILTLIFSFILNIINERRDHKRFNEWLKNYDSSSDNNNV